MPSVSTLFKGLVALAPMAAAAPANYARENHVGAPVGAVSATVPAVPAAPAATHSAVVGAPAPPAASAAAPAPAAPAPAAPAPAAAGGLSDIDILNFALTAEHLESEFYRQGFERFQLADFTALGLSEADVQALQKVGQTEATHVSTLIGVIASAGAKPVEACQYNFDAAFASADAMVKTARILEAVGVSAYLGAAPLVTSPDVLAAAGSIVTVEARHQAFIRNAAGAEPVPAAFDVALGPRAVFTLAAQFITSCPEGSNLNIQAFPAIALQNPEQAVVGQNLALADPAQPSGAQFCAFVAPGGNQFTPLTNGNCVVPQGLAGEVYMMITSSESIDDSAVLAGPSIIQPS